MSTLEIGIASFPALMVLIFLRVPIGLAMFLVGLFLSASALALELYLLMAAWMICLRLYSSVDAFSVRVLSLRPPSRLILFMSSPVSASQLWHR